MTDAKTDRPALSPPAEVPFAEVPFAAEDACLACNSPTPPAVYRPITMQDVRLHAGEGKLWAADVLAAVNAELQIRAQRTPAPVDWTVVGPKLVWLIERVDAERKRETVRLNHLKRAVAAVAAEARAALATTPQSNGE